jgi:hypothetical protein
MVSNSIDGNLVDYQVFNTQPAEVKFELPSPEANDYRNILAKPAVYFERPDNFDYTYKDREYVPVVYAYNDPNTFIMAYIDTTCTYTYNGINPEIFGVSFVLSDVCQYEEQT